MASGDRFPRIASDGPANSCADFPVVILAGARGHVVGRRQRPVRTPWWKSGGRPILWCIMKTYDQFGFGRFVLPVGYLGDIIKAYFLSYADRHADFTVDTLSGERVRHDNPPEAWSVTVVDPGLDTMTGGRVRRLSRHFLTASWIVVAGDSSGSDSREQGQQAS
jgi:glucose-1-phosphate cytidylyltransferase